MVNWKPDPFFPWVLVAEGAGNICPRRSINPGHWYGKTTNQGRLCRCYDLSIFNWDDDESPDKEQA